MLMDRGVAGRSTERPILSEDDIERNVQGIRAILQRLIMADNGSGPQPTILNNLVSLYSTCLSNPLLATVSPWVQ